MHDRQVMGDEHVGQAHLLLQVFHQVQDLCLDGHVQRRYRLVAHDELRVHRQGAGNADSLALSS